MSIRRLALLHATVGPMVRLDRVRSPAVHVTGLPEQGGLLVRVYAADGAVTVCQIDTNGTHPCSEGDWLQIEYVKGPKHHSTICNVIRAA